MSPAASSWHLSKFEKRPKMPPPTVEFILVAQRFACPTNWWASCYYYNDMLSFLHYFIVDLEMWWIYDVRLLDTLETTGKNGSGPECLAESYWQPMPKEGQRRLRLIDWLIWRLGGYGRWRLVLSIAVHGFLLASHWHMIYLLPLFSWLHRRFRPPARLT